MILDCIIVQLLSAATQATQEKCTAFPILYKQVKRFNFLVDHTKSSTKPTLNTPSDQSFFTFWYAISKNQLYDFISVDHLLCMFMSSRKTLLLYVKLKGIERKRKV